MFKPPCTVIQTYSACLFQARESTASLWPKPLTFSFDFFFFLSFLPKTKAVENIETLSIDISQTCLTYVETY